MPYVHGEQGKKGHLAFPSRESGTYRTLQRFVWLILHTVSETHGRVRFPWLVRQFTRLGIVAVTDGLPQKLEYGHTVRALPSWCYA
jgi:hypothetical protein